MKKFLLLLSLIMLAACITTYKDAEKSEQIQAMIFSQNKLYLLGKEQDYQLKVKEKSILELQRFWESPFAKKAHIDFYYFNVQDNHQVSITYYILINRSELTEQQIRLLKDKYGFYIDPSYRSYPFMSAVTYYKLEGEIVKLANRQELLAKYSFPTPLDTTVTYSTPHQELNVTKIITIIGLPITIPLMLIAQPVTR